MIRTPLCDLLGIEYPVFQGGMAWIADGKLAAAVSEGGGLGIIAAGNAPGDAVREQIQVAKSLTSRPFGVNIMLMSPFVEEVAQVVAEEKVAVVTTGAGNPTKYMALWKEAGIRVIPVVASVAMAKLMTRLGASALIAEGGESGGHVGELTTMVLVPQICDATTLPVIAAGGIADGHGLAAALALGASGVAMGTRFVCVDECPISDNHRQWVINHTEKDTVLCQKTIGSMMRVSKNNASLLANEIENRGLRTGKGPMDILKEQMPVITGQKTRVAFQDGNVDSAIFCAGMGMGLVHDVVPVKVLLDRMVKEAEETINSIKASF